MEKFKAAYQDLSSMKQENYDEDYQNALKAVEHARAVEKEEEEEEERRLEQEKIEKESIKKEISKKMSQEDYEQFNKDMEKELERLKQGQYL